jgi:hypothetical protein
MQTQPSQCAERVRRFRERRARGVKPVTVEISEDVLARMRQQGLLHPGEEQDTAALAQAIGFVLEDALAV